MPTRGRIALGLLVVLFSPGIVSSASLESTGTFEGSWTASGRVETLNLGESRSASILRLGGSIVVRSAGGLARALQSDCVGLRVQDETASGTGHCVWTDADGERLFSEIEGEIAGTLSEVRGTFVGGTGKYSGLEGSYELKWRYFRGIEEEGTVHGYSTSLSGSWRLP